MALNEIDRREFMGLTTASIAGGVLSLGSSSFGNAKGEEWNPKRPLVVTGKTLQVQPVLMYRVSTKREATSWKSWGGVQSEAAAATEAGRISKELESLAEESDFPIRVNPVIRVKTTGQAEVAHKESYDVVIAYAGAGSGDLLRACFAAKKDKDTIVFVRHKSGPTYYWYEALSTEYLKKAGGDSTKNTLSDHGGVCVDDVVVDDYEEVKWRLRALYGLKNFTGSRIVALGGPWGKYSPDAPQAACKRYGLDIVEVSYDDAKQRIERAKRDQGLVAAAWRSADQYLELPGTELVTERKFVANAFLLLRVFKDLMQEHDAAAFTIRECMTRILPIAETTPCLTLSLLNDEGVMAFCESDFVVIPAGILLHYITGKPVFLHNSTFPHNGVCTCAHCSAPRRMNGQRYEPAKIMTHYESEYGAAPKVAFAEGQQVTFIDPEYSSGRWIGFTGVVQSNPFYEICRTQQDVQIEGDWRRLLNEVRDSHWMMAYGDYVREAGYAARRVGVDWVEIHSR